MRNRRCFSQLIGLIVVYSGFTLFHSSCQPKNDPNDMVFSLFNPACWVDTLINNTETHTYKVDSYLVTGFQNTPEHEAKIDSFVCSILDSTCTLYSQYLILIYKKSKYTNNEHIKNNLRDLDRYSQENDFLYHYGWVNGIHYSKTSRKARQYYDELICK